MRKEMLFFLLSCGLAAAGCGKAVQETEPAITALGGESQPTIKPTSIPNATETAATLPPATETPIPPTDTPLPEPTARLMESVAILEGSTGPVYSLDWSPDGNVLASAGHSQVNLWGDGWEANQPVGSYELRMGD